MDTKECRLGSFKDESELDEAELCKGSEKQTDGNIPRNVERILRLLHLLMFNTCKRQDIFEHLDDYYNVGSSDQVGKGAISQATQKMLTRDIQFLEMTGFEVSKLRGDNNVIRYNIVSGSGYAPTLLMNEKEVDVLILLHTLFTDPAQYSQTNTTQLLPAPSPHNPFAEAILALIERLVTTLPPKHKQHFERWGRKPFIYFNMDTVTDYLPHRTTIDSIVQAISYHQQLQFEYTPMRRQQGTIHHDSVDPYYIIHQEGHLYLIGFSHKMNTFFEYRIDRIQAESLRRLPRRIDGERQRRPIEFRYWAYGNMATSNPSQRWLSQTVEKDEEYVEEGKQKRRMFIRAQAYSEWRIIQQLHKYGDQVELVDPPQLREKMRKEVERIYQRYNPTK